MNIVAIIVLAVFVVIALLFTLSLCASASAQEQHHDQLVARREMEKQKHHGLR